MGLRKLWLLVTILQIQSLSQTLPVAKVTVNEGTVTAGQTIPVPIELASPTPCPLGIWVNFRSPNGSTLQAYLNAPAGKSSLTLSMLIPLDVPAGVYTSSDGAMNPCPNYSQQKQFKVTPAAITVIAVPSTIDYPSSAVVKLSLTESQFLETKSKQLSELKSRLENELPKNRSSSQQLNTFLTGIATDAQSDLHVAIEQYDQEILKPNQPLPAFFADFSARYRNILSELGTASHGNRIAINSMRPVSLIYVQQLKSRDSNVAPNGEWPAIATELWQTIKEQIASYDRIKTTGRITFDAVLLSFPPGARIRYKKVVDDGYFDYSSPTDVSKADFDLARWDFIFIKDGCEDQNLRINPYEEKEPVTISVELRCKK